jgi:hypothetical protein
MRKLNQKLNYDEFLKEMIDYPGTPPQIIDMAFTLAEMTFDESKHWSEALAYMQELRAEKIIAEIGVGYENRNKKKNK